MSRGSRLQVVREDITTMRVDAIVNAANERMLGGGGVDGAIHAAAGPQLLEACRAVNEVSPGVRCPTGEARVTPGFDLPAKYVIHTVGPVWHGGGRAERSLLASCYRSSLRLAAELQVRTISFPAISCGVFRFPIDLAADIAVGEASAFLRTAPDFMVVSLVAFGAEVDAALREAIARREPSPHA